MVSDRYIATEPWKADRPENLVVCCSDGRWHEQVEDFIRAQVSERADMYVVPGGPAAFDIWNSSFDESQALEKSFRFLVEHHSLSTIWLIAHQDCAYYRAKQRSAGDASLRRRQYTDLDRAEQLILEWYPRLDAQKVYASLLDGGQVLFEKVLSPAEVGWSRGGQVLQISDSPGNTG